MVDNVHDEPTVDDTNQCEPLITHDLENPKIEVGASFPDVNTFRRVLRHFAIKSEFEVVTIMSDKKRFIGKYKESNCLWRINVSILQDNKTFMVNVLPHEHTCSSTTMVYEKMISKSWVSDRVTDWLRKNPSAGAKEVKRLLEDDFHVKVTYNKAWYGR
jgi:MuDR family transposase